MERMRLLAIWTVLAALAAALALGGCVKPLDLLGVVEQRVEEATNPQAGILVSSGGTGILSGGSKSMGSAVANSTYNDVAFLVENPGNAALDLSGTPNVAITGPNSGEFNVPAYPAASIAAGGSSAFTIRFQPTNVGAMNATVTIVNNTEDFPNFTIALTATATAAPVPAMAVSQTGAIAYNGAFPFPATIRTQTVDRVFTITNNGTANLTFGAPAVQVSGTGFALQGAPPAGPVLPGGGTATFTVRFSPSAVTSYSGTVTINSNDPTYPTFVFNLSGTGTEWHGIATVASTNDVGRYTSIGVSGANVYIAYQDVTNVDLKVVRSTNSALTWPSTYTPDATNAGQDTSMVIVGSDVYVAYCAAPSMLLYPRVVKGTSGTTWGSPVEIDTTNGGISPSLSYDGSSFYVAYAAGSPMMAHINKSTTAATGTWTNLDYNSYSRNSAGYVAGVASTGSFFIATNYSSNLYCDNNNDANTPYPCIYGTADGLANDEGRYVSAALAGTNTALLAYYDATVGNLKFVKANRTYSMDWVMSFSGRMNAETTNDVGQYTSIATPDGGTTIYISHYDATNGDLRLSKSTNGGTSWASSVVDNTAGATVGQYTSIAVDGSNVYISYYDVTNGNLKIAKSLDGGATW